MNVPARRTIASQLLPADPTRPADWPARRARGQMSFLLRFGVAWIGIPAGLLLDLALLVRRHDLPIFFSAEHAVQLQILVLGVGVPAGLIAGRVLWRLGERRAAEERLTREFDIVPDPGGDHTA